MKWNRKTYLQTTADQRPVVERGNLFFHKKVEAVAGKLGSLAWKQCALAFYQDHYICGVAWRHTPPPKK